MSKFDKRRMGTITGSQCHVLFPKRSALKGQQTYAHELAVQKVFNYLDQASSWQMDHGTDLEPMALEYYSNHFDPTLQPGEFRIKGHCSGTTDGLTENAVIDTKCPVSLKSWLDQWREDLSQTYYNQGQMYCYLFDKPKCIFAFYLAETYRMSEDGNVYPIPHDKRMFTKEVEADPEWVELLLERVPGFIAMRDEYIEQLKFLFDE